MYISFIRPLLEYSDSVWDNCTNEDKKQLDSIHTEAARIITGATKLCSIEKLYLDLGWETLQDRRTKHKLIIFFKMLNNLTPNYLSELVPARVQENNPYGLRNSNDIRTIHANSNVYFNSFLPSTIRAWNNLPDDTKTADSVISFKRLLNRNIKRAPGYFNSGSRKGQLLHARLRLECSSLNSHLYNKNIVNSALCTCGAFESPYHFFLYLSKIHRG